MLILEYKIKLNCKTKKYTMKRLEGIKILFRLYQSPQKEWENIKKLNLSVNDLFKRIGIPLLIVASLGSFVGGVLITESYGLKIGLTKSFITFFSIFLSVYFSGIILSYLIPKLGGVKEIKSVYFVLIFSFSFMAIMNTIADLHFNLKFFNLLGLYTLYLLYLGTKNLIRLQDDRIAGFSFVSFIMVVLFYALFQLILSMFFLT